MPIFLYGQGVAGCVEVTFFPGQGDFSRTPVHAVGSANGWIFTPPDTSSDPDNYLMKVFFGLILALLP
jgi:hypothetical protein